MEGDTKGRNGLAGAVIRNGQSSGQYRLAGTSPWEYDEMSQEEWLHAASIGVKNDTTSWKFSSSDFRVVC